MTHVLTSPHPAHYRWPAAALTTWSQVQGCRVKLLGQWSGGDVDAGTRCKEWPHAPPSRGCPGVFSRVTFYLHTSRTQHTTSVSLFTSSVYKVSVTLYKEYRVTQTPCSPATFPWALHILQTLDTFWGHCLGTKKFKIFLSCVFTQIRQ